MKKCKVKYHTVLKCSWCREDIYKCNNCGEYFDYNDIIYCDGSPIVEIRKCDWLESKHYCDLCAINLKKEN